MDNDGRKELEIVKVAYHCPPISPSLAPLMASLDDQEASQTAANPSAHELLPAARIMTLLVDRSNPAVAETAANQMLAAARTLRAGVACAECQHRK